MNRHRMDGATSTDSSVEDVSSNCSTSSNENVQRWKQVARTLSMREQTMRQEFQEYQENSTAYESEMEALYKETEQINQKLRQANEELEEQNKTLRGKLNTTNALVNNLQVEMQKIKIDNEKLSKYVRVVENENDKLERISREMQVMGEEKEYELNQTIEKLALLETDLEENLSLHETVQRLKDENRDLINHIKIEQSRQKNSSRMSSSSDETSRNDIDNSLNLSLRGRVSLMEKKLKVDNDSKRSSKSSDEEKGKSKRDGNQNFLSVYAETSVKQNFKAVIDELKEGTNPLPKKRKQWSLKSSRSVRDESPSSYTGNEYFLKKSDYEPTRKKDQKSFFGWLRKKNSSKNQTFE